MSMDTVPAFSAPSPKSLSLGYLVLAIFFSFSFRIFLFCRIKCNIDNDDERTDRQTDRQTEGRNGPTTFNRADRKSVV